MSTEFHLRPPVLPGRQDESYWLQSTAGLETKQCPALAGSATADLAIVGGGLTGLWTALRVLEKDPSLNVVVLEAGTCGAGASGRNGGQVHSWFESLDRLAAVTDADEALRLAQASADAINELEALQDSGEVDMDLRLDGWLWTASSTAQEGAWQEALNLCAANGVSPYRVLDAEEIRQRTGSDASYQGVVEDRAGSLHPGKLMRNLKMHALRKGVTIYENTPVTTIAAGRPATLTTPGGSLSAGNVLLATNAWASSVPELRQKMYVVDSQVIATEPIPDRLDELGWKSGEAVCDAQNQVLYYQRTPDGRVIFGRGSGGTIFGDRLGATQNRHPRWVADSVAEFRRVYPTLSDVRIDYDWLGAIDCVPAHVPIFGNLKGQDNLFYAIGWNGTGLAQIPACSRIIASMILKTDDVWGRSKLINQQQAKSLPPEPVRFLGAHMVRAALVRKNALEIRNRRPDLMTRALVALMPKGTSEHD
ncbi:NAD(P)/FAD-dependent oxidoreductase [Arthrobacter sedimenti]|uniref:NAD(P)/FAD-dependent oxidoreductase n=1 Tax=Arthrobacter sedimenti TaxID=2694931 RepID=UPI000B3638CE|nr:FAD-dependent oxidoreductase [Arthrobacter sedimenti]OUM43481.1 amino acid oxidase [Arthrobacter agilis]